MDFSVGLAVYDFLPVLLTGIALFYVWRMTQTFAPGQAIFAAIGGTLVVTAGLTKASWKLIVATTGTDIYLLSQLLFPLMAPGFILVMFGVWGLVRRANDKVVPAWFWVLPLVVICSAFSWAGYRMFIEQIERGWFQPLLILVSIGNVALISMLISVSVRNKKWGLAGLFFLNIVMTFALQPIAAMENLSITMHWIEQTLTAAGAGTFAFAAYGLSQVLLSISDAQPLRINDEPIFANLIG
ncbi:MAG: hypothetical protein AAF846_25445 [Chloroflexota bacterium]